NVKTHPEFADALENAKASGVEVWFLPCKVKADCLEIVE
ncbi:MAG: DNA/RNA nuclease SfsA, partial [Treponema sp.]|nr:DNA/RNA nuclease SfsA [Treponema sp.]